MIIQRRFVLGMITEMHFRPYLSDSIQMAQSIPALLRQPIAWIVSRIPQLLTPIIIRLRLQLESIQHSQLQIILNQNLAILTSLLNKIIQKLLCIDLRMACIFKTIWVAPRAPRLLFMCCSVTYPLFQEHLQAGAYILNGQPRKHQPCRTLGYQVKNSDSQSRIILAGYSS